MLVFCSNSTIRIQATTKSVARLQREEGVRRVTCTARYIEYELVTARLGRRYLVDGFIQVRTCTHMLIDSFDRNSDPCCHSDWMSSGVLCVQITDQMMDSAQHRFPHNTPPTKARLAARLRAPYSLSLMCNHLFVEHPNGWMHSRAARNTVSMFDNLHTVNIFMGHSPCRCTAMVR